MSGVRIKSLQAATPLLYEQFDRMLFVVDLAEPDTTLCLSGAELKAAVGLKEHAHPLEDVDGLVGELEKKLNKEGETTLTVNLWQNGAQLDDSFFTEATITWRKYNKLGVLDTSWDTNGSKT